MSVLGCDLPLMQAPLGRGAAAPPAVAVSQAGGLGTLGASWTEPAALREQIRSIGRATDRPFCVNLVLDFEQDERLEVAIEERVPWVSFSFGMRRQMIERVHARGTRAMVQVASADAARAAADAGATSSRGAPVEQRDRWRCRHHLAVEGGPARVRVRAVSGQGCGVVGVHRVVAELREVLVGR